MKKIIKLSLLAGAVTAAGASHSPYLNDIDREKLSNVGKTEYDRIYSYFSENNISFNSGIFISPK